MRLSFPFVLLLATSVGPSLHAQRLYRVELSAAAGYFMYDEKTELGNAVGGALRLGYWITGPLSVEVEGTIASPKTDLDQSVSVKSLGGWLLANAAIGKSSSAFVKAGYASVGYGDSCPDVSTPGSGPCGSAGAIQGGIGFRLALTPTIMMRYEATINQSQTSLKFSNVGLYGGVSLMLGSKPLVDSDSDKVWDRSDKCANTPRGALVDKHGCPTDRDEDGVADGIDRCPNTVPGAAVNDVGCTSDSDGDRVLDGIDKCPDTPIGAVVDQLGCPVDTDKDRVPDGLDRCAQTPDGATVDELGCPGDADNDGVFDGLDRCDNTPAGVPVNVFGCPPTQDSDKDGVLDAIDRCPGTLPGVAVLGDGCPVRQQPDTAAPTRQLPPPPVKPGGQGWVVAGSVFAMRSATLGPQARPILDSVAVAMHADTNLTVLIEGFAQDRLVPTDNLRLSQQRADAAKTYILGKGIAPQRVTAVGRGSQSLLVADTTEAARTTNRRLEIKMQTVKPQ
jgi:outer membrane protein OmpA-like peptidoglycan-associated protein